MHFTVFEGHFLLVVGTKDCRRLTGAWQGLSDGDGTKLVQT
jgi:hypothetical protein